MKNNYYIYILTNFTNTVLYIGVTRDLKNRMYQHKSKSIPGFTQKYNTTKLVYFEEYQNIMEAIRREKQLKNWHRDWKLNLIQQKNPNLKELHIG